MIYFFNSISLKSKTIISLNFLFKKNLKQKRFRQKELFIEGFHKTISLPSTFKSTKDNG